WGNIGEAYRFGPPFLVLLLILVYGTLLMAGRFWSTNPRWFSTVLLTPLYFAFTRMHQYPLRHTVRFFVLQVVLILGLKLINSIALRSRGREKEGAYV